MDIAIVILVLIAIIVGGLIIWDFRSEDKKTDNEPTSEWDSMNDDR